MQAQKIHAIIFIYKRLTASVIIVDVSEQCACVLLARHHGRIAGVYLVSYIWVTEWSLFDSSLNTSWSLTTLRTGVSLETSNLLMPEFATDRAQNESGHPMSWMFSACIRNTTRTETGEGSVWRMIQLSAHCFQRLFGIIWPYTKDAIKTTNNWNIFICLQDPFMQVNFYEIWFSF